MKTVDFSETIAACDLKIGRCRQLIEFMKVCEYSRSRSFILTLAQGHLHMKIKLAFLSYHWTIFSLILNVSLKVQGNENSSR